MIFVIVVSHDNIRAVASVMAPMFCNSPPSAGLSADQVHNNPLVGSSHAAVVIDVLDRIPAAVPFDEKISADATMAGFARTHTPSDLRILGARVLAHLDPDGDLT
ncbi:hypothetical protein P3L18_28350, partial [Gordonia sp. N1V]|nr:hypothetical protein [Gordonia sp. N1V]